MNPTCKHGHELTDDNVVIRRGRRVCKTCEHIHAARTRAKKRAATAPVGVAVNDPDV